MYVLSPLVLSDSLQPHGLQPSRLFCLWFSPGKSTVVGCHSLLQGIFPTRGLNPCLLHLLHQRVDSLPLATWEATGLNVGPPKDMLTSCPTDCFRKREGTFTQKGQCKDKAREWSSGTETKKPQYANSPPKLEELRKRSPLEPEEGVQPC